MSSTTDVIAVDLGASSGRLVVGRWNGNSLSMEELHRFQNRGVFLTDSLYWDMLRIWTEIEDGLRLYGRQGGTSPAAIGVDSWGVDFALLDTEGKLIGNPYHYRDHRTEGLSKYMEEMMRAKELFCRTGVQPASINTLAQLYSMARKKDRRLAIAHQLLMIPDCIQYFLTGVAATEVSIASTTQMLSAGSSKWDRELIERFELPAQILPDIAEQGSIRGAVRSAVLDECRLPEPFSVVSVASHDTASAVAAISDLDETSAFVCCGTWSLMGVVTKAPVVSEEALCLGFTNESGPAGDNLLMKNLTGFWVLQECLRSQDEEIGRELWMELTEAAGRTMPLRSIFDPSDPRFMAPKDMRVAICDYCVLTGQPSPATTAEFARACFDSLCLSYQATLEAIASLTGRSIRTIRVVGGGARNTLFCQMMADACKRVIVSGPVEASAFGNAVMQLMATGNLSSLAEGRDVIKASGSLKVFEPRSGGEWMEGIQKYRKVSNFLSYGASTH